MMGREETELVSWAQTRVRGLGNGREGGLKGKRNEALCSHQAVSTALRAQTLQGRTLCFAAANQAGAC